MQARLRHALPLLLLCTCDSLDDLALSETARAQIPRGNVVSMLTSDLGFDGLSSIDLASSEEFANQGVSRNQIDAVRLTRLNLAVVAPDAQDLAFLDRLAFFVSADGLERQRIAVATEFPQGTRSVDLQLDDVDLVEYVAAPSMTVDTEATGRSPDVDTTIEVTLDFLVDVDVSGAAGCN